MRPHRKHSGVKPRILVIRGGAIGDFVLTLPSIRLLRENFPGAHLEILGYRHIVALAEGRFHADAARSIEYAALAQFFAPGAELDPGLVEYFASFQQVVSYLFDPDGFFETNVRRCGVKHFLVCPPKLDDSAHAAHQLARPLQSLALFLEDAGATLHPSADDCAFADDFLAGFPQPLLALHPGSGSAKKNWALENWREIGEWLMDFRFPAGGENPSLLVLGGEADGANLAALENAWLHNPRVRFAKNLPLPHAAALLARCALFLGHDSGISHIAAAAGAPCLLLFGPTDPQIWAPANPHVRVLRARDKTMNGIGIEDVQGGVAEIAGKKQTNPVP